MPPAPPEVLTEADDRHATDSGSTPVEGHPKFPRDERGFQAELRRRVTAYFTQSGRAERDCRPMYLKTLIILGWLAVAYGLLVFAATTWWQAVPLAILIGLGVSAIGFNIQHDGGHHGYSRHEWVNRLAAMSLDFIGASSYLWRWKHGVLHHTYSNITGHDTDVETAGVARLSPHQPRYWFHRWQHLYLWPLYSLTASRWHLYGDFRDVAVGKVGDHRIPRPKGWDLVVFWLGKVVSIGWMLVLPMFFHEWWVVLAYYFLATAAAGVFLTVVFQLAHCVEEADFPMPEEGTLRMADAWAIHQVQTTVNFARDSRFWSWLLGGLNFQIEHHLFPRVCHVHYPALSKVVEQTCQDYGVRYTAHPTFFAGVRSHFRWLRRMGRPDAS